MKTTKILASVLFHKVNFGGKKVCVMCTDCGIQGIITAMRGAIVLAVYPSREQVINANLNFEMAGFKKAALAIKSNLFSKIPKNKKFDYIIINPHARKLTDVILNQAPYFLKPGGVIIMLYPGDLARLPKGRFITRHLFRFVDSKAIISVYRLRLIKNLKSAGSPMRKASAAYPLDSKKPEPPPVLEIKMKLMQHERFNLTKRYLLIRIPQNLCLEGRFTFLAQSLKILYGWQKATQITLALRDYSADRVKINLALVKQWLSEAEPNLNFRTEIKQSKTNRWLIVDPLTPAASPLVYPEAVSGNRHPRGS